MKLTEEKLKQIILEEVERFAATNKSEPNRRDNSDAKDASGKEQATDSMTKLKKELVDVSRNIQNVKGLDAKEISLISGLIGVVLSLSSQGSASTILQRVYNVLQKQAK